MGRRHDRLGHAAAFGLACAATLVVFTIARGHYYMLLLPANVFAPLWLLRAGRWRWACAVAAVPPILVISHYAALHHAGRIGLLGLGTTAWYFATCGVLLWPAKAAATALRDAPTTEPVTAPIDRAQAA